MLHRVDTQNAQYCLCSFFWSPHISGFDNLSLTVFCCHLWAISTFFYTHSVTHLHRIPSSMDVEVFIRYWASWMGWTPMTCTLNRSNLGPYLGSLTFYLLAWWFEKYWKFICCNKLLGNWYLSSKEPQSTSILSLFGLLLMFLGIMAFLWIVLRLSNQNSRYRYPWNIFWSLVRSQGLYTIEWQYTRWVCQNFHHFYHRSTSQAQNRIV